MTRLIFALVVIAALAAGCVMYPTQPQTRFVEGQAVAADSGLPLSGARVSFRSDGSPQVLMPIRNGVFAIVKADKEGKFGLSARLFDEVEVTVEKEDYYQSFRLPAFPKSGRLDGIVLKVGKKKPNSSEPTRGSGP